MYSYKKAYEEMKAEKERTIKALDEVIKTQREEIDLYKFEVAELRKRNADLQAKRDEYIKRKQAQKQEQGYHRQWRKREDMPEHGKLTDPDDERNYDENNCDKDEK